MNIRFRGFQHLAGEFSTFLDDLVRARPKRSRRPSSNAKRLFPSPKASRSIALDQGDFIYIDIETITEHLGINSFMRLSVRHAAKAHLDLAVRQTGHDRAVRDPGPAGLE